MKPFFFLCVLFHPLPFLFPHQLMLMLTSVSLSLRLCGQFNSNQVRRTEPLRERPPGPHLNIAAQPWQKMTHVSNDFTSIQGQIPTSLIRHTCQRFQLVHIPVTSLCLVWGQLWEALIIHYSQIYKMCKADKEVFLTYLTFAWPKNLCFI